MSSAVIVNNIEWTASISTTARVPAVCCAVVDLCSVSWRSIFLCVRFDGAGDDASLANVLF